MGKPGRSNLFPRGTVGQENHSGPLNKSQINIWSSGRVLSSHRGGWVRALGGARLYLRHNASLASVFLVLGVAQNDGVDGLGAVRVSSCKHGPIFLFFILFKYNLSSNIYEAL